MTAISLVLVDFDDTIVDTGSRFQSARRHLFALLEQSGFPQTDVYRVHHDEVDPAMRQKFGLGPARMEHSFRSTYETLCLAGGLTVDEAIAERAALLGRAIAGTPPVIHGALEALTRLAAALPTALYTQSGDPEYQIRCIDECGVLNVIPRQRVRICERKTTEQFRTTLDDFRVADPSTVWMIGNSMRSDINPALEAGANAILVEVEDPWVFDVVEPVSAAFHRAASFREAVNLLLP